MQVDAVKSVAMPMTRAGSMPASLTAAGTASPSARVQSAGSWRAQSGGSSPCPSRARSIAPCGYSLTAVPASAPSLTRTTSARADSVPKSTPTTKAPSPSSGGSPPLLALTSICPPYDTFFQCILAFRGSDQPNLFRSARRPGGARPDDQLGRHPDPGPGRDGAGHPVDKRTQRLPADLTEVLPHGGERRTVVARLGYVGETDDADVLGNRQAPVGQRADGPERHRVVPAEDGGKTGLVGQPGTQGVSGARRPVALQRGGLGRAGLAQRLPPAVDPLLGVQAVGGPGDVVDGSVAKAEQVAGRRGGAG